MLTNLLYIDPAATSILITSISTIVIALGATFFLLWNKAKKKVCKTLHVDENAHKEVEDEIVLTEDVQAESAETKEAEVVAESVEEPKEENK